ncbi:MAG: hypothetical protein M3Y27_13425 [Acidobacteriota bacterium]|nr:hypothetical protein [Acidobacteriota bacterium]
MALTRAESNAYKALPGEGTHTQLWRLFSRSPQPGSRKLAVIALRLKEKRERADYETSFVRVAEEVPTLLADAQEFAVLLNMLPASRSNPSSMRQ